MNLQVLAWSLGAGLGAMVAAMLGAFVPSWALAAAPLIATAACAAAAVHAPRDRLAATLLRGLTAFDVVFVAVLVALTLDQLGRSEEAAAEARDLLGVSAGGSVEGALAIRWTVMGVAAILGIFGLFLRRRATRVDAPTPQD